MAEPIVLMGPLLQAAVERAAAAVPADKRGQVSIRMTVQGLEMEASTRLWGGADVSTFWQPRKGADSFGARFNWKF